MTTAASVAVVSGGASGIGAATAGRLRTSAATVIVLDRAQPADIECDVGDGVGVADAFARVAATVGVPTRVVASAGIGHHGSLIDTSSADFERVLRTNLLGTWHVLRAGAVAMIEAGVGGSMVAVSSISGTLADQDMGAYCVSKAAVDMLIRVAAVEWGAHGIRVNAVGPGVTLTPLLGDPERRNPGWAAELTERTALGRLGTAEEVAEAIVGLLEMSWVTGQVLATDGGLSLHSPIDPSGARRRAESREA
jgi:NAD(P)-dependent dehydrogenase (short-subunit alcohol dehydrogenase family)